MTSLNIFECEEDLATNAKTYHLVNKRGRRVEGAQWTEEPTLQSGVFLTTDNQVFTVLGDTVKLEADKVYAIINFWVYYCRNGQDYVARLEPLGLKFRLKVEKPVESVGYLSHDGCVIMENSVWNIYNYSFNTLILDNTVPQVSVTHDKVYDILKMGFTVDYLKYLVGTDDTVTLDSINKYDTLSAWKDSNKDFNKVVVKLSEVMDKYSPEQLGSILGLKSYIISVLIQYLEIYDFVSVNTEES